MADVVESALREKANEIFDAATANLMRIAATEIESLRARLSQAGAGGGVVVKPLEWQEEFRDGTFVKLIALTPFGAYEASSEFTALTDKGPMTALPRWKGQLDNTSHEAVSLDEAKAGAQADYESRILTALAPSPSAGALDLSQAFITAVAGDGKPYVKIQFQTLAEMQECHRALVTTPPATPVQPTASVEAVREALRPFAVIADEFEAAYTKPLPDDAPVANGWLKLGECRRAREALAALNPAPGHGEGGL